MAQTYGLKFQGQDVTLDKRTELSLTPDGFFKFQEEFEISFDYKIERVNPNATFGYVFRIINSENQNVDLLSTPSPVLRLNVVAGKNNSYIPVDFPINWVGKWLNLRIKFLLADDKLIFYTPDSFYVSEGIGFKKRDEFKIIFGANDFNQFKTTDGPSISIKNLKIFEKVEDIVTHFVDVRVGFYIKRKKFIIDKLNRELTLITGKARFIRDIIEGQLVISNVPKNEIIQNLKSLNQLLFMIERWNIL
jgi:hypothetical protein